MVFYGPAGTLGCFLEGQLDVSAQVIAALGGRPGSSRARGRPTEEHIEYVSEASEVTKARGTRIESLIEPLVPIAVVDLALLGIGENLIRFVDLLEALLGLDIFGVDVGMMLAGEVPVSLFDIVDTRIS